MPLSLEPEESLSKHITAILLICEMEIWFIAHVWLFWSAVNQAVFSRRCLLFLYCQSMWQGGDGLLKHDPPPNINSSGPVMKTMSAFVCACLFACHCVCVLVNGRINKLVHHHSLSQSSSVTGKQITDLWRASSDDGLKKTPHSRCRCSAFYGCVPLLCDCARLCIIEHFEPLSQYASNESSAPTSKWLFLNKPCLIDCVPPRHSPSGGCCVTASLKLQISICHSGSSAACGLMGVLVNATSLQNKAVKMQRKLDGSLSRLTRSSPDHRWHQIWTHRDRSALNRGICAKSSGDTHNITGSGSARRGSTPPLPPRHEPTDVRSEGSQSAAL